MPHHGADAELAALLPEVTGPSGIAVYRLPFWHYTTPLIARRGREHEARRWLLLGSFDFDPPPKRLRYR